MEVTRETWLERMGNLVERRKTEVIKNAVPGVDNYKAHINKCHVGKFVLDVGCGSMIIKDCLPEDVEYTGIDPFPMKEGVIKMEIEQNSFRDKWFETIYCFAALDNMISFEAAIREMKRVCSKNIVFLTGIDIKPDKYHTIEITEQNLINEMKPFEVGYKEYLHPRILLIEFVCKDS